MNRQAAMAAGKITSGVKYQRQHRTVCSKCGIERFVLLFFCSGLLDIKSNLALVFTIA